MFKREYRLQAESGTVIRALERALAGASQSVVGVSAPGVEGVQGRIRGTRIKLWLRRTWIAGESDPLELRASILDGSGRSCRTVVEVEISRAHSPWLAPTLIASLAAVALLSGGAGVGSTLLVVSVSVVLLAIELVRRAGDEDDAETRYLDAWLNDVVTPCENDGPGWMRDRRPGVDSGERLR